MKQKTNIKKGFSHPQLTSSRFPKGSMLINTEEYKKHLTVKGLSPKSIKTYVARFVIFENWLKTNNKELSSRSVEDFIYEKKNKGYSNAGINSYIQALNYIAKCYKSYGHKSDFMDDISCLPKKKSDRIALSLDEAISLINTPLSYKNRNGVDCSNLDLIYLTITEFILLTGCRYHEASSLKITQLDINRGTAFLTDTKTREPRYLFFDGIVKDHLKDLISARSYEDLVFVNSKNSEIHSGDFWNNLKQRAKKAGITKKMHPHLLRHTYATLYYKKTHDIHMVSKLLGHKDIKTTSDTYVHTDFEEIQRASKLHPLMSRYLPIEDVLQDYKSTFDNLGAKDDIRLDYRADLMGKELIIRVKAIEA